MMRSENIEELAASLIEVQKVLEGAKRVRDNPFFHSKYPDLAECWDRIREPLTANALAITQATDVDESGAVVLETVLIHESGEYIGGRLRMQPEKETPAALGSCITYARRYALMAIIGLAAIDDDDGNAASTKSPAWDGKHWQTCPVHIGRNPGTPLGAMDVEAIEWLINKWNPGSCKEDIQLTKALRQMTVGACTIIEGESPSNADAATDTPPQ